MARISIGPVGNISVGHVLDCNKAPLERALRDYDPLLYVKWNPKKLGRHGCWEVRRKPEEKTIRPNDVVVYKGCTLVYPKYHELDLIAHVMDVPYLNYLIFEKLKKMDMWNTKDMGEKGKNFVKHAEYLEGKYYEKLEDQAIEELAYGMKQIKSEMRDFKQYIADGGSPTVLADAWNQSK